MGRVHTTKSQTLVEPIALARHAREVPHRNTVNKSKSFAPAGHFFYFSGAITLALSN